MEAHRSVWPHCIAFAERIHVRVGSSERKEIKSATRSAGIFPKQNSLEAQRDFCMLNCNYHEKNL